MSVALGDVLRQSKLGLWQAWGTTRLEHSTTSLQLASPNWMLDFGGFILAVQGDTSSWGKKK